MLRDFSTSHLQESGEAPSPALSGTNLFDNIFLSSGHTHTAGDGVRMSGKRFLPSITESREVWTGARRYVRIVKTDARDAVSRIINGTRYNYTRSAGSKRYVQNKTNACTRGFFFFLATPPSWAPRPRQPTVSIIIIIIIREISQVKIVIEVFVRDAQLYDDDDTVTSQRSIDRQSGRTRDGGRRRPREFSSQLCENNMLRSNRSPFRILTLPTRNETRWRKWYPLIGQIRRCSF